jgi:hypothetical protein
MGTMPIQHTEESFVKQKAIVNTDLTYMQYLIKNVHIITIGGSGYGIHLPLVSGEEPSGQVVVGEDGRGWDG